MGQSKWWIKRIIDRRKGLGKRIRAEEEKSMEFSGFGDCRGFRVIASIAVGDIPGSVYLPNLKCGGHYIGNSGCV